MTDEARDELLIRIDERLKSIEGKLAEDYRHIHGNGQPGLLDRVKSLEDHRAASEHHHGALLAIVGFLVNAAIAVYAIIKKSMGADI